MADSSYADKSLSNRYQPRPQLPSSFPDVLKEYAREVLRAQPTDILAWSADYFQKLALEEDPHAVVNPSSGVSHQPVSAPSSGPDPERDEIAQRLLRAFAQLDASRTGSLSAQVVKQVLMKQLGLSECQALYILTSEYTNLQGDDTLAYERFAKDAALPVQFFIKSHRDFSLEVPDGVTVHGMTRDDVEQEFLQACHEADSEGTGQLSVVAYRSLVKHAPFHLTPRDIRLLSLECSNEYGAVSYEDEIVIMFDRLVLAEAFDSFEANL
ncbi:hypothetical protein STCU_08168 [Strigomonas culicis]|uniref:RIIa domain-containing protein n=1 Tax=Strigomonas culicis TaxID=28005 RepID=S9VHN1_9TRYP|nr:hypothetical protein STCU_08168 [Strigomonas culicis]|eukprot:EPY22700.1 hypothetical protein STCU_08168 [Strigomonas culicis]